MALLEIQSGASDTSPTGAEPEMWRDKAKAAVANVLNLYQAWSMLIQFKNNVKLPPHAKRAFPIQSLLDWLSVQLELVPPAKVKQNIDLFGNQPSIQEALLLLYSASSTQGSGVHLMLDYAEQGAWVRIRFTRPKPLPKTLSELINDFDNHWRSQDAAFELRTAQDFIAMNESEIQVRWHEADKIGEFAVFIFKANVKRDVQPKLPDTISPQQENARFIANITRSLIHPPQTKATEPQKASEASPTVEPETSKTTEPVPSADVEANRATVEAEAAIISTDDEDTIPSDERKTAELPQLLADAKAKPDGTDSAIPDEPDRTSREVRLLKEEITSPKGKALIADLNLKAMESRDDKSAAQVPSPPKPKTQKDDTQPPSRIVSVALPPVEAPLLLFKKETKKDKATNGASSTKEGDSTQPVEPVQEK